jgi:hypothetical protein
VVGVPEEQTAEYWKAKYEDMVERKRWHVGLLHEHILYHTRKYAELEKALREGRVEL